MLLRDDPFQDEESSDGVDLDRNIQKQESYG